MNRALAVGLVFAATLLAACSEGLPGARIVVFSASHERIPRGTEVTLLWQAADAGVRDGLLSCVLTRRLGTEVTETPLPAGCSGGLTEVPPAPVTAASVEYRFKVLKQPYDPADPYVTQARSITLDPALYATRAGGATFDEATGVRSLPDGGAIVVGRYGGTAAFGATTLTSVSGGSDVFVARIRPDGTWAWATSAGGAGFDTAYGASVLADGGAVVAGSFQGTAAFGTIALQSVAGGTDAFVARIRPDGAWAWATSAGGNSIDLADDIAAQADGGAIVTGGFSGTATFGTDILFGAAYLDGFVARIDPDGVWSWVKGVGDGDTAASPRSVGALPDGGAIIAGDFRGSATFGTTTFDSIADYDDAFVARIRSDGTWVWATSAGGAAGDYAYDVGALTDGGAMVTGIFSGTATFGTNTLASAGGEDAFVARIRSDGTWAWATSAGGADYDHAYLVATLADDGAIVSGAFRGNPAFGSTTLDSAGDERAFVARVGPDGAWAWARSTGGPNLALPGGMSAVDDGGAIVAGYFVGTTTIGARTLGSAGEWDAFVARIGGDGAW